MAFLNNKEIGNRLKTKREGTKLSSRKFAIQADIDVSQYAKIEKGDLPITKNILDKLVKVHGLDRNWVLYGTFVPQETEDDFNLLREDENHYNQEVLKTDNQPTDISSLIQTGLIHAKNYERLITLIESKYGPKMDLDSPGAKGTITTIPETSNTAQ